MHALAAGSLNPPQLGATVAWGALGRSRAGQGVCLSVWPGVGSEAGRLVCTSVFTPSGPESGGSRTEQL